MERLLKKENLRRYNLKPEPEAENHIRAAKVEVPRALIELSVSQMEKPGSEPPCPSHDEHMNIMRASVNQ